MRLLFTFVGGLGHLEPLLPIARAARQAGHTVAFGCDPAMRAPVEAAGFAVHPLGRPASRPPPRLPLRPLDPFREERELRERFVERAARFRVPLVRALAEDWRADALVRDETDFGTAVAAERLGLPCATVLVTAAGSFVRKETVADALDVLRDEHGLPPDPELAALSRGLVLAPFPRRFRDPAHPLPPTAHTIRPASAPDDAGEAARRAGSAPPWRVTRPGVPTLYVTLGTVFQLESGDLLARLVAALRTLPLELVVTVGPELDPAELGAQPAHVHVARYRPQAEVLPHCAAVVSHAGSGSVMGALAHGLPSLLLPLGADQPANAARCVALGAAKVLDASAWSPSDLHEALAALLEEPSWRKSAERLRDEIRALPGPETAVPRLERLGRD